MKSLNVVSGFATNEVEWSECFKNLKETCSNGIATKESSNGFLLVTLQKINEGSGTNL